MSRARVIILDVKETRGFLQTTRFTKSFGVALALSLLSGSIWYGIGALLFLLFSFAFNDWVDSPKDVVGHPHRAIPSGKITRTQSGFIFSALFITGVSYSILLLDQYLIGFMCIYVLSVLYSFILKPYLPVLATPVWSASIAILFVQPFTNQLTVYFAIASIVYGYEMLLDYRDRDSDKQFCKTPTLANILGKGTYVVFTLAFLGGAILLGWSLL